MSKSTGNYFTVRDLLAKGATPAAIRLELVRTHYRQNANFTLQGLRDCGRMIDRWCGLRDRLRGGHGPTGDGPGPLARALPGFTDAIAEDLNIAKAIGVLNEAFNAYSDEPEGHAEHASEELAALMSMDLVLDVLDRNEAASSASEGAEDIEAQIAARAEAKATKDWARADAIRDELLGMGIAIHDSPEGTTWSRVVE